jgi:hypothetical protein
MATEQGKDNNNKNFIISNPFLSGAGLWQSLITYWFNACGEFLKNNAKITQDWYDTFWEPWLNWAPRQQQQHQQQQDEDNSATIDITKATDMSPEIIDIMNTPDVAIWNKGMQIKGDAAEVVNRSNEAERTTKITPRTTSIGLKKNGSKDFIIDPAEKKTVVKVVKSEATLTDESDLS